MLGGFRWQSCLIYLDGLIVFSRSTDLRHVDEVLTLLRRAGITLKLRKCTFFQPKVDYLGHIITPGKLENTKTFAHAQFPRNTTQLRSFLGAANVYRRFVTGYSGIARPLNAMLRKDAETDWDSPTNDEIEVFEAIKRKLVTPPILGLPKANGTYIIDTDASAYQLGATFYSNKTKQSRTNGTRFDTGRRR